MRSTLRNLLLLGASTLTHNFLWGQTPAPRRELDLAVTYNSERSNITPGNFFWRQGGTAELSAELYRGFGVALNLAGSKASNILNSGIDLDTVTTTVGPRYTWHGRNGKVSVFGQALFGESHGWNSLFPKTGGAVSSASVFALQVGGGLDLKVGRHFSVRPIQADWVRTQFPNATTDVQNNLRLGAGVVLRIPR